MQRGPELAAPPRIQGKLRFPRLARHQPVQLLGKHEHIGKAVAFPRGLVTQAFELQSAGDLQWVHRGFAHQDELLAQLLELPRHGRLGMGGRREPLPDATLHGILGRPQVPQDSRAQPAASHGSMSSAWPSAPGSGGALGSGWPEPRKL